MKASPQQLAPCPAVAHSRAQAALRIMAIERHVVRSSRGMLDLLAGRFEPEAHYPPDEVTDEITHAQYFYHAHAAGNRHGDEHGHFHTFLGRQAIPPHIHPFVFPEIALAPLAAHGELAAPTTSGPRFPGVFAHLIGVGVDGEGKPTSLFTTNRWVTGETWFGAEHMTAMLPAFRFVSPRDTAMASLSEWLACVLHVLRPIARTLLQERDRKIADWRRRRTRHIHVLDDRRLEVVSERRIDFATELDLALRAAD